MRNLILAVLLGAVALAAAPVPPERPAAREIAYGAAPLQRIDFYAPASAGKPAPLLVFIHGGGWKRGDKGNATGASKVTHFTAAGYAFASINYRLVPSARVEDQAQDVADALAWMIGHASELGIDPKRVVLMGHSAGAHLAALVGTDPAWFRKAGLAPDAVKGIVLLDGAAYDVPSQLEDGPRIMHATYQQAFGTDPARQRSLSPFFQAAAPNAPAFLLLHVDRDDGARQTEALANALRQAGTRAEVRALPGRGLRGHMQINRELGDADYPGTSIVDAWIAGVHGPR